MALALALALAVFSFSRRHSHGDRRRERTGVVEHTFADLLKLLVVLHGVWKLDVGLVGSWVGCLALARGRFRGSSGSQAGAGASIGGAEDENRRWRYYRGVPNGGRDELGGCGCPSEAGCRLRRTRESGGASGKEEGRPSTSQTKVATIKRASRPGLVLKTKGSRGGK